MSYFLPIAFAVLVVPFLIARFRATDDRLVSAISLNFVTNGVSTTRDGRVFMTIARLDGSDGPRVVEWTSNAQKPYPDNAWNSWTIGKDPKGCRSYVTDKDNRSLLNPRKLRLGRHAGSRSSILKFDVRSSSVVKAISASAWASAAPMQKCGPCPNERAMPSSREISSRSGSENLSGSRFAEPKRRTTVWPFLIC